jgi:flavodoxin I
MMSSAIVIDSNLKYQSSEASRMKTLIIYDSFFGNTEQIARAAGQSLNVGNDGILRVDDVKPEHLKGVDLLIVGSPTRGFRPSEKTAAFLKALPADACKGTKVAAFDTRIAVNEIKQAPLRFLVKLGGYAAAPIAKQLQAKGGTLVMPPEGFFVKDRQGPLKPGEIERAQNWAVSISQKALTVV